MEYVFALCLILFGCAGEKSSEPTPQAASSKSSLLPTTEEARTLLSSAPEFGDYQFTNAALALPLDRSKMNDPAKNAARDLEKAGWLESQRNEIVLSSRSAEDKRFLVRPNGFLEIVPLAKKEITEVGAVTEGPDGKPVVSFCWRWIPNEVGASLTSGPHKERFDRTHCAKATLIRIGDVWEVLVIEEADAPKEADAAG